MEQFYVDSRERLRAEIRKRWEAQLRLSYTFLGQILGALPRGSIILDSEAKRAALFLTLKAARTFQSILVLFENGLMQDARALLRPLIETVVDAGYIFMNSDEMPARAEAFVAHLPRSASRLERTRKRVLPEYGGPREEYEKQLAEGLANLPANSEKDTHWTRVSLEDRIKEVDQLLVDGGGARIFRFMVAVYGDACQILHSDIAGARFYMEPDDKLGLRFVSMGPDVPEDDVPLHFGLTALTLTLSAIADILAPAIKSELERMAAEIRGLYDARSQERT